MLHSLSQGLPDALFGKTLREVYITFLTNSGSDDWNQFTRLIGLFSAQELRNRVEACITVLKEVADTSLMVFSISNPLILFQEELKRLEVEEDTNSPNTRNIFVPLGKKMDKFELKAVRKI